jgi:DNA-binding NarL/FixJ family response regulator
MAVTCQDIGIKSNQSGRVSVVASRESGRSGAPSTHAQARLSPDELVLLRLLSEGLSADVIGRRLGLSDRTIRRRLRSVCDRVGVDSPIEAVVWAVRGRHI